MDDMQNLKSYLRFLGIKGKFVTDFVAWVY
jgi:hypothetical protein